MNATILLGYAEAKWRRPVRASDAGRGPGPFWRGRLGALPGLACERHRAPVQRRHLLYQPGGLEHVPGGSEAVGGDHLGPGGDVVHMDLPDCVRIRQQRRSTFFQRPLFQSTSISFPGASAPSRQAISSMLRVLRENGVLSVLREGSGRRPQVLAFSDLINLCEDREIISEGLHSSE